MLTTLKTPCTKRRVTQRLAYETSGTSLRHKNALRRSSEFHGLESTATPTVMEGRPHLFNNLPLTSRFYTDILLTEAQL